MCLQSSMMCLQSPLPSFTAALFHLYWPARRDPWFLQFFYCGDPHVRSTMAGVVVVTILWRHVVAAVMCGCCCAARLLHNPFARCCWRASQSLAAAAVSAAAALPCGHGAICQHMPVVQSRCVIAPVAQPVGLMYIAKSLHPQLQSTASPPDTVTSIDAWQHHRGLGAARTNRSDTDSTIARWQETTIVPLSTPLPLPLLPLSEPMQPIDINRLSDSLRRIASFIMVILRTVRVCRSAALSPSLA